MIVIINHEISIRYRPFGIFTGLIIKVSTEYTFYGYFDRLIKIEINKINIVQTKLYTKNRHKINNREFN